MRWTTAWLLALAVHVAGIATIWLCWRAVERAPRASVPDTIEVAMLDQAPRVPRVEPRAVTTPEPRPTPTTREHHRPRDRARERNRTRESAAFAAPELPRSAAEPAPPSPVVPRATPPSSLAPPLSPVARAPAVDLNLRRDPIADLAPSPPAAGASGTLDTTTLHGEIARDGAMHVRSKAPVSVGSDLLSAGDVLKDWLKDPKAHAAAGDGTVGILRGKFDVTDSVMRAFGQDPYRAQRMKMLDDTREQRLTLAARDRTARQQGELAALPATLRNIWNDGAYPADERRRIIFQLWDECQEAAEGEAESAAAGAHARREIVLFIRSRVGEGSPYAYPKEELAALNLTRQSRQRFDPYGRSPL